MGGWNQAQAHAQFVSNVADHDMNIQAALEAARFTKLTFGGYDVLVEDGIPERVRTALGTRGPQLQVQGRFSSLFGGGQSAMRDFAGGVNFGASNPRKDGAAVPEPIVWATASRRRSRLDRSTSPGRSVSLHLHNAFATRGPSAGHPC